MVPGRHSKLVSLFNLDQIVTSNHAYDRIQRPWRPLEYNTGKLTSFSSSLDALMGHDTARLPTKLFAINLLARRPRTSRAAAHAARFVAEHPIVRRAQGTSLLIEPVGWVERLRNPSPCLRPFAKFRTMIADIACPILGIDSKLHHAMER